MNGHCRRAHETLVALGWELAHVGADGKRTYTHANAPDERLKLWAGMTEQASRAVLDKARQIAGLSCVGAKSPATVRERARIRQAEATQRRAAEAARADRERAPYQRALDAAHAEEKAWRKSRGLQSLMMPGRPR